MTQQEIINQALGSTSFNQLSPEAQYYRAYGTMPTQQQVSQQTALNTVSPGSVVDVRDYGAGSTAALVGGASILQPNAVIKQPTSTSEMTNLNTSGLNLPGVSSTSVLGNYTNSLLSNLQNQRSAVETAYKQQIDLQTQRYNEAQAKIDEYNKRSEGILAEAKPYTEPFRQTLETSERERLKIEENYFANQQLTNELGGLLTSIQNALETQKGITGLAAIRNPRIDQATEDMAARVGVIEAVMAARNNQIGVAENLIDRSVNAITADRTDKLNYYNTLLNFYGGLKSEEGAKLTAANKEQQTWVKAQIGLIENDLANAQSTADYIKKLMIDPDTAQALGQAGVKLTDPPEVINKKLTDFYYSKELSDISNLKASQGYKPVVAGQPIPPGATTTTTTDSRGNTKQWYTTQSDVNLQTIGSAEGGYYSFNPRTGETKPITVGGAPISSNVIKLTEEDKRALIGAGFLAADLTLLQNDISKFGLDVVLARTDLTAAQKAAIQKVYNKTTTPSAEDFRASIKTAIESRKAMGATRADVEAELEKAYTTNGSLPSYIDAMIQDALVEVYGQTFWQKWIPGGR